MAKILCIPDFHQDLFFVKKIISKEIEKNDKVIFLGDAFDSFSPKNTIEEVCLYLEELKATLKEKFIFLKSNHDVSYFFHYQRAKLYKAIQKFTPFYCSGFSKRKAYDVAKYLSLDFINNTKLAHFEDGVLYTHAGARPELFKYINDKFDIDGFIKEADRLNEVWQWEPLHPFFQVGDERGGHSEFGGILWADLWADHRIYSEKLPTQVFGHTPIKKPYKIGNNHCIDCGQTYYAIVDNGEVTYKEV